MRGVKAGEVWIIDFGIAAKVRPALLLTGEPAADELDSQTISKTGRIPPATSADHFYG